MIRVRSLFVTALLVAAAAACGPNAYASPPDVRPGHAMSVLAPDTAKVAVVDTTTGNPLACVFQGSSASVKCQVTVSVTVEGAQAMQRVVEVLAGAPFPVIAVPIACSPLKNVTTTWTAKGFNASGGSSGGASIPVPNARCPDGTATDPTVGNGRVTVTITTGGSQ